MPPAKRCFSVLVVSGKKQNIALLTAMLDTSVYRPVDSALSAGEAKRKMLRNIYDILIVDPPLPDEFGSDFAVDATTMSHAGVMITVRSDLFELTCAKVENAGVLTVSKPIPPKEFHMALKLITATSARLLNEEKKAHKIQEKLEELKLVSRAKFILIEKHRMTEAEAHRFIEKEAMDSRRSKAAVAEEIIDKE